MGYKKLLSKAVDIAFDNLKDLKTDVYVFTKRNNTYNFLENEIVPEEVLTYKLSGVLTTKETQGSVKNSSSYSLILQKKDLPDLALIDKLSINDKTYIIDSNDSIIDNGYTIKLSCREVLNE